MKIGVRGQDFGRHSPETAASILAGTGAGAAEFNFPKFIEGADSYSAAAPSLAARLGDALRSKGIDPVAISMGIPAPLAGGADRDRFFGEFAGLIRCAMALGCPCCIFDTGLFSDPEGSRAKAFGALSELVGLMLRDSRAAGIRLAFRPAAWHTVNGPELAEKLISRFEGSGLAAVFDPAALYTPETAARQNEFWRECLHAFGPDMPVIIVRDGTLAKGILTPCPLGRGELDYKTVIAPWLAENGRGSALICAELAPAYASRDLSWTRDTFLRA